LPSPIALLDDCRYNHALEQQSDKKIFTFQHTLKRVFEHPAMLLLHARDVASKPAGKRAAAAAAAAAAIDAAELDVLPVDDGPSVLPSQWWEGLWPAAGQPRERIFAPDLSGKVSAFDCL